MAITFRAATTASTRGGPIELTKPAGTTAGDLLVALIGKSDTGSITLAGWTALRVDVDDRIEVTVLYRFATGSEGASFAFAYSGGATAVGALAAYGGVDADAPFLASAAQAWPGSVTITAPSVSIEVAGTVLSFFASRSQASLSTPAGTTSRAALSDGGGSAVSVRLVDAAAPAGATTPRTSTASSTARALGTTVALRPKNYPPGPPTIISPPDGSAIDRGSPNIFELQANDPDAGDTTSKSFWRYRIEGTSTWTVVSRTSPVTTYEFPADHFALGGYELQAATRDADGLPVDEADLAWSASVFFTVADRLDAPHWLDPINGQSLPSNIHTGTISAPDVDEAEYRLYADDGGVMGTTQVQAAQIKTAGARRTVTWAGLDNGVPVWWWARIKHAGLWSEPVAVRTPVSYTPPPSPSFTIGADEQTGSLLISVTNPAPSGTEPQVAYNRIEVDDADGRGWGTRHGSAMVARNGVWRYWLARSGVDYRERVRVVAVGENGTSSTTTGAS